MWRFPALPPALDLCGLEQRRRRIPVILALMIVNIGVNSTKGPVWAMPSMFLTGASAAAGIALINSMGNLGGFVGPVLIGWMKDRWGSYTAGLDVVGAMCALSAVVVVVLARGTERRAPVA